MDHSPTPAPPAPPHGDVTPPGDASDETLDLDGVDLSCIAAELGAVESALERLDAGGYGACASCGDPIDDDLLATDPTALSCPAHLRL